MSYSHTISGKTYRFSSLKELMAKASPLRSGDQLAGIGTFSGEERAAAQYTLSDLPLKAFLEDMIIPYELDEVTRLIIDTHNKTAFQSISHFTVGELRNWLLLDETDSTALAQVSSGITPEMAAAVSKVMRIQDMILVSSKCQVTTQFNNTIGLAGRLSVRLQPNHPTDDLRGIAASIIDGLFYGSGDAVIGINPASDNNETIRGLLFLMESIISKFSIPTQMCVLSHITNTIDLINQSVPIDLVFQSIAGTESANKSFGINLSILKEGYDASRELNRGKVGNNTMYFETGQGSCLSANAHHSVDQQTLEARAYAVARHFKPLLVNTVAGFIGPEYLYNGKQIIRAGIEDHFCGKLLGLPMGCDICYTNHAEADQDDMDMLLTLLGAAGCSFIMGIPGSDDIMLNYQSTSFHDALYIRKLLDLRPAPEFEEWLIKMNILDEKLLPTNHFEPQKLLGLF